MIEIQEILRRDGLRIDHPEEQEGLVLSIAEGEIPTDYENSYQLDYKVRCAFCKNRTPHQWGVTAILDDGRRALCGNCCAKRLFGDEIHEQLKSSLKEREIAVVNRELISPLLEGVDHVIEEIKKLLTLERTVTNDVAWLKQHLPSSWQHKINDSGRLTVHDYSGQYIGSIKGLTALTNDERNLFRAGTELYHIKKILSDDPSDEEIKQAGLKRQEAIRLIKQGIRFLEHAKILFASDENFELLSIWYEEQNSEYSRREMKFIRIEPGTYTTDDYTYTIDEVDREVIFIDGDRESNSKKILDGSDFDNLPSSEDLINHLRRK